MMNTGTKDSSYCHRLEMAVRTLATSTDSSIRRIELAFTSYILAIIPLTPKDSIDEKLCRARALATSEKAQGDEGPIRATLSNADSSTMEEIMTLIFDAYREMLKRSSR